MREFLMMGGYGGYVWTAYGIAAAVLGGLIWSSSASLRRVESALKQMDGSESEAQMVGSRGATSGTGASGAMRVGAFIPILAFVLVAVVLVVALIWGRPQELPSPLVGRAVPEFNLPALDKHTQGLSAADLRAGKVVLLNVWASWCLPCRAEHRLLSELARGHGILLFGINYKDGAENARAFLDDLGDPYARIGYDPRGRVAIDFGVSGVPETFVIDGTGRIVAKYPGPLTEAIVERRILPAIVSASGGEG